MHSHNCFLPLNRVRKNAEFQKIRHCGIRIRNRHLILNYQNTQKDQPRLGVVIAKRQVARAVDRNRIKRRVKEWFRLKKSHLLAQDYVIIVTRSARDLSSVGLNQCLDSLLQKANSQSAN